MYISSVDVEKAVLRIFRDLRIPAGSGLRQSTLIKEWARTSLRRSDLDSSLRRLFALCYLKPERTPEGEMIFLTPVGKEYAEQMFDSPLYNVLVRLRMRLLALLRRWETMRPAPLSHRRLADRIEPTLHRAERS